MCRVTQCAGIRKDYCVSVESDASFIVCFFLFIPAFVSTPTSVNATLGSTATFNCSTNATGGIIGWIINGSLLSELNIADVTTSNIGHTLHVPATEKYNNTNVTCVVAILGGDYMYSDPVVLQIQGIHGGKNM